MEIERKYLIHQIPFTLDSYPCHHIEQGYLCTNPVVRIRRQNDEYILTYKSKGLLAREEQNLPLTEEGYFHMREKIDGILIDKVRYLIPLSPYTIELDVFSGAHEGLILAEVEFSSIEEADAFTPPSWFGQEVTMCGDFHNSSLSKHPFKK